MIQSINYTVNMTTVSEDDLRQQIEELQQELTLFRFAMVHILARTNDTLADINQWQRWQDSNTEIDYLIKFRDEIINSFNRAEFIDLCMSLHVDFDDLGGDGLGEKARELILYFKRRNQLQELRDHIRLLRPRGRWTNVIS